MNILQQDYTLSNQIAIPKLGFGTWQIPDSDAAFAVGEALRCGYRHIDTALAYENENGVGQAVRESGLDRSSLFITTKIPAEFKSYDMAKSAIASSLKNLNIGYIDLLLIHCPTPWAEFRENPRKTYYDENLAVWRAMEEAVANKTVRSIGVSNFEPADIANLTKRASIKPVVNQIAYHIGYTQQEITSYCEANDILIEGYSPVATGRLLRNEKIAAIAQKYGVSTVQICIRYALQNGVLPLPKSVHSEYILENTKLDFSISAEDMSVLNNLPNG